MTDFGDFDDADAFDTAPPDPEQVARYLHELRVGDGFELVDWDALERGERAALVAIMAALLAHLAREGTL